MVENTINVKRHISGMFNGKLGKLAELFNMPLNPIVYIVQCRYNFLLPNNFKICSAILIPTIHITLRM